MTVATRSATGAAGVLARLLGWMSPATTSACGLASTGCSAAGSTNPGEQASTGGRLVTRSTAA
ncbi:hypothetical protein D3C72_2538860 [compost metagenome]